MPSTRQDKILAHLKDSGFARLHELAETLEASESTIRRDLIALEQDGVVQRTHGGVIFSQKTGPHFSSGHPTPEPAKIAIARTASKLIEDGDTILLDGGSTTLEIAKLLVGRRIQIITNSIPIANLFTSDDAADVVMLGGFIYARSAVALGPLTVAMLENLNCQRVFLSAAGINESGLFNSNLLLVETEQAMMRCADCVTVVADSAKFGRKGMTQLCKLNDINEIIVDNRLPAPWKKNLKANGIKVLTASVPQPES